MNAKLSTVVVQTIRSAARKLTGAKRRAFQAETTRDYCNGSPRIAERRFGWSRATVQKGLTEQKIGQVIADHKRSGCPSYSQRLPQLQEDIRSLVDPNTCTHPTFDNTFRYTRMTAKRQAGWSNHFRLSKSAIKVRRQPETPKICQPFCLFYLSFQPIRERLEQ